MDFDFSPLVYFFTIAAGLAFGFAAALVIALVAGPTWWVVAPMLLGLLGGIMLGHRWSR